MTRGRNTVRVGSKSRAALESPRFLIEKDGKLYLSLAVLEYDPEHPGVTSEQKESMERLRGQLGSGQGLRAVEFGGSGQAEQGEPQMMMMASFDGGTEFAATDPPDEP